MGASLYFGLGDDDRIVGDLRFEWNGIASPRHADRLRIDGRGAVLADHALRAFVETDGAADFASVKNRGNLAVGLLIKEEADLASMLSGGIPMQFAVVNRFQRDDSDVDGLRKAAQGEKIQCRTS